MLFEKTNQELFHLGFDPKSYRADYAILPGDPDRVLKIAAFLDSYVPVAKKREYTSVIGEIGGKKVLSRRPSGLRKTRHIINSLAHRTTWLRSDFIFGFLCSCSEKAGIHFRDRRNRW